MRHLNYTATTAVQQVAGHPYPDVGARLLTGLDETVDNVIRCVVELSAADSWKCNRLCAVFVRHVQTRTDHRAQ